MIAPGQDPTSPYSRHVAARFADFTNPKTPWSRRLWHGHLVLGAEPLQLATRADLAIAMASDSAMGFAVVDLLGRD